jgi:hypothetical protein
VVGDDQRLVRLARVAAAGRDGLVGGNLELVGVGLLLVGAEDIGKNPN